MNTIKVTIITFSIMLITGCMQSISEVDNKAQILKAENSMYMQASKNSNQREAKRIGKKQIKANFVSASVFYAVSQVAKSIGVQMDRDFIPASSVKVTANFRGTFADFLDYIYQESGVKYKVRNGVLAVFNKGEVEKARKKMGCGKGNESISIAMKNVNPAAVFSHMSKTYGLNFVFNMKYYSLGEESESKPKMGKTTFFYKGCDRVEALEKFIRANDLRMKITGKNNVEIFDYTTAEIDVPTYFDMSFSGGGNGLGGEGGSGQEQQSGGENGVRLKENFKEDFTKYLRDQATPRAKIYLTHRGYVTITDTPSSVRNIKKMIRSEKRRQSPIKLNVSIISVDVKDELRVGVDWTRAFANIADKTGYDIVTAMMSGASQATGGLSVTASKNGISQIVNALQEYGEAKIERTYSVNTRSGMLSTFRSVEEIPYITTSTMASVGGSQTTAEAKVAIAGIIINMLPSLSDKGEVVNLATSIELSDYKGDKVFNVQGAEYKLPQISKNNINVPARLHMGDTVVLTGLKLTKRTLDKNGIPVASQLSHMAGGLFGSNAGISNVSEYLVLVSVSPVREY